MGEKGIYGVGERIREREEQATEEPMLSCKLKPIQICTASGQRIVCVEG